MNTLDRKKLDAVNQMGSNIFAWRGQFPPQFVGWDLRRAFSRIISAQSL
jgi:hypothetical protein